MKNHRWLTISVALALAVVMLWAVPTLAQGRGKGQGGQGGQGWGCGQGQGAGSNTCPAYPAYQSGQGNPGNNPQANTGRRGPRGGGRIISPTPSPLRPRPNNFKRNAVTANAAPSFFPPGRGRLFCQSPAPGRTSSLGCLRTRLPEMTRDGPGDHRRHPWIFGPG